MTPDEQGLDPRFTDRTVIVTGAASGLGRSIARGARAAGATVVAADVDRDGLDDLAADGIIGVPTDVSDRTAVQALATAALDATGRIDMLVNNAGNAGRGTTLDMPLGTFETTMAIHTFGALYGLQAVGPHMLERRWGRIVNMVSRGAESPMPDGTSYTAAKAALFALTRSFAMETRGSGVLVNGMIPGPTNSAIWGRDMPQMQSPDATWPAARELLGLADDGPTGKVFWDGVEYRLFHPDRNGGRGPLS